MYPPLLLFRSDLAGHIISSRQQFLDVAMQDARESNRKGALYPRQSGATGLHAQLPRVPLWAEFMGFSRLRPAVSIVVQKVSDDPAVNCNTKAVSGRSDCNNKLALNDSM
jgi:hypothetical protein